MWVWLDPSVCAAERLGCCGVSTIGVKRRDEWPRKRSDGFYARYAKRAIDLLVSLVGLVVCSPVLLGAALAIRFTQGRPVFFVQERIGYREAPFLLIKFRTMTNERDESGGLLRDELRLFGLGRVLRSSSVDELPSLWNVLVGDMSLVGPRPLLPRYLPFYTTGERRRALVRPGITGLAQIEGRNAASWEDRFERDIAYVDGISPALDFRILTRTLVAVLLRRNVLMGDSVALEDLDVERFDQPVPAGGETN